jgi:hypothetical protein
VTILAEKMDWKTAATLVGEKVGKKAALTVLRKVVLKG